MTPPDVMRPTIGNLSGHAHPSASLRRQFGILRPAAPDLGTMLHETEAVSALASLLEQSMAKVKTTDGRVDMQDLAHAILSVARPSSVVQAKVAAVHGRKVADLLPAMVDDATAVHALSLLLTEAFETRQQPGTGQIDMRDVAAHVLAEMRRHRP